MRVLGSALLILAFLLSLFPISTARAAAGEEQASPIEPGPQGTSVYLGEYRFLPPPSPWELIRGGEGSDFVFGYYRRDRGKLPLESTFLAFSEEPYGYSSDISRRADEFLKRFFWSSQVKMGVVDRRGVNVLGEEGLALLLEGKDPVKGVKVRSKVVFGKRGERVVAFYVNQWRSMDGQFDQSAFNTFDRFVESFRFLKQSFYQTL